jgi:pimeloyl-[acyl-carrier protein] methyl ester esterase
MSLAVETSGRGPDLVLVHGWGMNAAVWEGMPREITGAYRLTRIELPGHGASPFGPEHADRLGWARACLELAPPRAAWLGWSLGGLIALQAALLAPQRISALVLLTATPRFVRAPDWPAAMDPQVLAQFHDALVAEPKLALDRFLHLQVRGSEAARETLRLLRAELDQRPAPRPEALGLGLDLLRDGDLRDAIPELACPSLWVFGERDTLVPAAASAGVSVLRPDAKVRVIAGAAHAPFLSHPEQTAAAIGPFLAESAP